MHRLGDVENLAEFFFRNFLQEGRRRRFRGIAHFLCHGRESAGRRGIPLFLRKRVDIVEQIVETRRFGHLDFRRNRPVGLFPERFRDFGFLIGVLFKERKYRGVRNVFDLLAKDVELLRRISVVFPKLGKDFGNLFFVESRSFPKVRFDVGQSSVRPFPNYAFAVLFDDVLERQKRFRRNFPHDALCRRIFRRAFEKPP